MNPLRISGPSERLGNVYTSDEFLTWEVPDSESSSRMRRLLSEMGRLTVALDETKYSGLTFGERAAASFIESEDFRGGREESAHQVRFGQMILSGNDFREHPEFVAIKSFDDRAVLYTEWAAHEYINSLFDRQVGYLNLGVHNDATGIESIISQYDHDVTSFDSSFWADENQPTSALRPEVLQRHAALGLQGLGMFHGARIIHGDAAVKNLAADRLGPRAIDLETAEILDADTVDDAEAYVKTRRDIDMFISSMVLVDENKQRVIDALKADEVADRLTEAYEMGVREGRATLDGEYVPDFARQNTPTILDSLSDILR